MKIAHLAVWYLLLPAPAPAQQLQEYAVDAGHSIVEFSVGFAFSRVKGRFTHSKGTILYDSIRPERSSVTLVIESKTIDTGWPHRDEHLRTSDFFDVEKYPTIVFQSEQLTKAGNGWIADGTLTMHGVSKRIKVPFRLTQPPSRSPESNWMLLNAEGAMRLARADFGIFGGSNFNSWFDKARAATMSDSVDISFEIEGWNADAQSQRVAPVEQALERIKTTGVNSQIERLRARQKADPKNFHRTLVGSDLVMRGLIATGQTNDAVVLSRAMTELYPTAPRAWIAHGLALAIAGDARGAAKQYAKAEEVFRPAIVDPNEKFPQIDEDWYYLDQLVRTLLEWNRPGVAVPIARSIARMYASFPRAQTTLGVALAASGDEKGAAAAYAKALALDPLEPRTLEWRQRLARAAGGG
jgi:polyisoprenoid-binding protein YceI